MTERTIFAVTSRLLVTSLWIETGDNHYLASDVNRERATNLCSAFARYTTSEVNYMSPSRSVLSETPTDCSSRERGEILCNNELNHRSINDI